MAIELPPLPYEKNALEPNISAETLEYHYGKQARSGRKVGHATLCAPDAKDLVTRLTELADALGRGEQAEPVVKALG